MIIKCPFCQQVVPEPQEDSSLECKMVCYHCGALYWPKAVHNLFFVVAEAADYLRVQPEQIELAAIRDFDMLLEFPNLGNKKESASLEDVEVCLVFVRKKPANKT